MIRKTGGGTFDPEATHVYFFASNPTVTMDAFNRLGRPKNFHFLTAVNDLTGSTERNHLEYLLSEGCKVFLDSGVFWLTNRHKREHNITMDAALSLAPDQIDGFDWLWDNYIELVGAYENDLWGYVELDQGGAENKRKTRAKLHDLGFNPIPVFHPLVDGWEYYNELAETTDRICFGNVVQASTPTRVRLLAAANELHKKYPHVWVHLLGYTPDQNLFAYPNAAQSCDSSSWLTGIRWTNSWVEKTNLARFSKMNPSMIYKMGVKQQILDSMGVQVTQFNASTSIWFEYAEQLQEIVNQ